MKHTPSDIVSILKYLPSQAILSLKVGNLTRNTLLYLSNILKYIEMLNILILDKENNSIVPLRMEKKITSNAHTLLPTNLLKVSHNNSSLISIPFNENEVDNLSLRLVDNILVLQLYSNLPKNT